MSIERETSLGEKIDRYFRREDTVLATSFRILSPQPGENYRGSQTKRVFEVSVATPMVIAAAPIIVYLDRRVHQEDGGPSRYQQERLGPNGSIVVIEKIRCMVENADTNRAMAYDENVLENGPETDPRCTKIGRIMRAANLEELPQLFQVLQGKLALVGLRAVDQKAIERYQEIGHWSSNRFSGWINQYVENSPGLFSLWAAMRKTKDDLKRYHWDMLYARKASLGLDLYILYKTTMDNLRKIEEIRRKKISKP